LKTEQRIWEYNLPDSAHECVKDVMEHFPTVGIEMLKGDDIFVPVMTQMIHDHVVIENLSHIEMPLEQIPTGCIKVLFATDEKTMDELIEYIGNKDYKHLDFLRSAKEYYEILPPGVTKGSALVKLCEILDVDIKNTIAVGDYNNDIQMIMNANLGVAVANAPQEVKDCADFVTVSNDQNAIAAVIDKVLNEFE
ncbi:MAG: HAD hydrolase family protein, partial [Oscillospiraceae bacterium]|nr:HAD hydrolase family protein [Oscillospiraceae bacterium]